MTATLQDPVASVEASVPAYGSHQRNQTADALRALAALWVCLYHFTGGVGIGAFGYLGVTIFFVISGFIVPYSMMRGRYVIASWPRFMLRRLIRLEPPYLVSVALLLTLGVIDMLAGTAPAWTAAQIVGHLGYVNAFLGLPWLNSVYWSLAVEFQFYVLIGLALPLLLAGTSATRIAALALVACLPLLLPTRSNATIFPFLSVFAMGILTFLRSSDMIGRASTGLCWQHLRELSSRSTTQVLLWRPREAQLCSRPSASHGSS